MQGAIEHTVTGPYFKSIICQHLNIQVYLKIDILLSICFSHYDLNQRFMDFKYNNFPSWTCKFVETLKNLWNLLT